LCGLVLLPRRGLIEDARCYPVFYWSSSVIRTRQKYRSVKACRVLPCRACHAICDPPLPRSLPPSLFPFPSAPKLIRAEHVTIALQSDSPGESGRPNAAREPVDDGSGRFPQSRRSCVSRRTAVPSRRRARARRSNLHRSAVSFRVFFCVCARVQHPCPRGPPICLARMRHA
jgi:hypothetical protein